MWSRDSAPSCFISRDLAGAVQALVAAVEAVDHVERARRYRHACRGRAAPDPRLALARIIASLPDEIVGLVWCASQFSGDLDIGVAGKVQPERLGRIGRRRRIRRHLDPLQQCSHPARRKRNGNVDGTTLTGLGVSAIASK